jgi:hypothetical protein
MNCKQLMLSMIVVLLGLAPGAYGAPPTWDHLIPVDPNVEPDVRAAYQRKLFLTPADCARMLVRSSWTGEFAVSVHTIRSRSDTCQVTLTKAAENIWYFLQHHPGETGQIQINVSKYDVDIDCRDAFEIKEIWELMLRRRHTPTFSIELPVDGDVTEFSLDKRSAAAELPVNPGRDVARLEKIGLILARYCEAPVDERGRLVTSFRKEIRRLKTDLGISRASKRVVRKRGQ